MVLMNDLAYKILARTEDATGHLRTASTRITAPRKTELEILVKKYMQLSSEIDVLIGWLQASIDEIQNDTFLDIDANNFQNDDDPDDDDPDDDLQDDQEEEQQQEQHDPPPNIHNLKIG